MQVCRITEAATDAYVTECLSEVVLKKSVPAQIRQLFLYISNNEG
jgi:hypothetical protein